MKLFANTRLFAIMMMGLWACFGFGQSKFYGSVRPDAIVVVKKSSMGSDLVEITIQGNDYPKPAVDAMMTRLGKALGNDPRNVEASIDGPVIRVSFAVVGLITDGKPRVNIGALAKSLGFGEKPIRSFSVFFADLAADVNTPTQWFPKNGSWKMEGVSMRAPKGLDYRVSVTTTNPNDIYMPDSKTPTVDSGKPVASERANIFIFASIIVGAFAIGLLVYSALLRPRPRGR